MVVRCSKNRRCSQLRRTVSWTGQASPVSGSVKRLPRSKSMLSSKDFAAGSKLHETTFHGAARPRARVNRCSIAMALTLAGGAAQIQP